MPSVVDTSVKIFKSSQIGAPVLSGSAGALISVLDACLVNGWGLKTLDSLVINNNVATMNIASGHSFIIGTVVQITGATPAALNGEQRITSITGNSASFAVAGISNQTATGTITAKIAPAGFTKAFSGTNLAAYKPTDPQATGALLRVNDAGTNTAQVVGYETMTGVNTGSGLFPNTTQAADNYYWTKSGNEDTSARDWAIYADSRGFIFCARYNTSYGYNIYAWGDIIPTKPNDPFCTYLIGDQTPLSHTTPTNGGSLVYSALSATAGNVLTRSYTGLGGSKLVGRSSMSFGTSGTVWSGTSGLVYPNPTNGGLYITPINIIEDNCLRGVMFGVHVIPHSVPNSTFSHFDTISNVASMQGRTFELLNLLANNTPYAIDVTGPWR